MYEYAGAPALPLTPLAAAATPTAASDTATQLHFFTAWPPRPPPNQSEFIIATPVFSRAVSFQRSGRRSRVGIGTALDLSAIRIDVRLPPPQDNLREVNKCILITLRQLRASIVEELKTED